MSLASYGVDSSVRNSQQKLFQFQYQGRFVLQSHQSVTYILIPGSRLRRLRSYISELFTILKFKKYTFLSNFQIIGSNF